MHSTLLQALRQDPKYPQPVIKIVHAIPRLLATLLLPSASTRLRVREGDQSAPLSPDQHALIRSVACLQHFGLSVAVFGFRRGASNRIRPATTRRSLRGAMSSHFYSDTPSTSASPESRGFWLPSSAPQRRHYRPAISTLCVPSKHSDARETESIESSAGPSRRAERRRNSWMSARFGGIAVLLTIASVVGFFPVIVGASAVDSVDSDEFGNGYRASPYRRAYTNQWAIRIEGGDPQKADDLASKYGYINLGAVIPGGEYFLFENSRVRRRSSRKLRSTRTSYITREPEVKWMEQMVAKRRVKRDYVKSRSKRYEDGGGYLRATVSNSVDKDMYVNVSPSYKSSETTRSRGNGRKYGATTPNDPLWQEMWYLHRSDKLAGSRDVRDVTVSQDHNVRDAWNLGFTGKGVVVTILDDGLERTHPDLLPNYDPEASYDVNERDDDPMPRYDYTDENRHGTRCAGEVAAIFNNSMCAVGIAYNAKIGGIRMLDGDVTDAVEAASLGHNSQHIDIYSASWGPDDDGRTVDGPARLTRIAFEHGIKEGRGGKGSIFVWASGNGGKDFDSCNCDGYTNSIYTLSISSATEKGEIPWYSEACSSTMATTYSSGQTGDKMVVTTDLHNSCTKAHTGTSASAPLAAGIVALALEANPNLTWRDLQHIVVRTARPVGLLSGDWKTNGAGRNVSHSFGYGLMDAGAIVRLAQNWTTVPEQRKCRVSFPARYKTIPHGNSLELSLYVDGCQGSKEDHLVYAEHVQVIVTLTAPKRGDIQIHLFSPSGTKSTLLAKRARDTSRTGFRDWAFTSVHYWGEEVRGLWYLVIENGGWDDAELVKWDLVVYGTQERVGKHGGEHSASMTPRSIETPLSLLKGPNQCFSSKHSDAREAKITESSAEPRRRRERRRNSWMSARFGAIAVLLTIASVVGFFPVIVGASAVDSVDSDEFGSGYRASPYRRAYTNQWAIRIEGGDPQKADDLASKYGYINLGAVIPGGEYFLFENSRVRRRSSRKLRSTRTSYITREPEVKWMEQMVARKRVKRGLLSGAPNDPKWKDLWYLNRKEYTGEMDHNIIEAWNLGFTGKGVVVTIMDDGIERTHSDLRANYDPKASIDLNGKDDDPSPRYDLEGGNNHGTRCAGEVAAVFNNSVCTVGVAYNAKIGGIRMLDGDVTDATEGKAFSFNSQYIDIYSASWGPTDDGMTVDGPKQLGKAALENGGRGGRGSIFVWSSGNGGVDDSCACDGYASSIYTISISSSSDKGEIPWYSEACSSTMATTYSSGQTGDKMVVTTDLHNSCTKAHTGTSASAPLAAGIVALALEANPNLTWRDLQHIVVRTARPVGLLSGDWKTNGAGRNVSHSFGYGLMDAGAIVRLAQNWTTVPEQRKCRVSFPARYKTIPHGNSLELSLYVDGCQGSKEDHLVYAEHVQVIVTLTAPKRGDIFMYLLSPSGTNSTLLPKRPLDKSREGLNDWEFTSVHYWGEKVRGSWKLVVGNDSEQDGTLDSVELVIFGTHERIGSLGGTSRKSQGNSIDFFPESDEDAAVSMSLSSVILMFLVCSYLIL
ncbi:hypothetical protein QR680_008753 [Steinernema hermaphroditum]|uniref:P/Homo B domain-containing protein n=1 Tax=Steinernema hermaphroditum TaxID=289476 RepID=A0AA39IJR0_9BILA|nr:hypothetical protein QR680_008753 [Steinernema hermaphroditum]